MTGVAVKASGLVTAVGFNAQTTCAAIRGRISGAKTANLWDAEAGENIAAARVPLPQWWEGPDFLAELVAPAIHECRAAAQPAEPEQIPLLLGVCSPKRPFRSDYLDTKLLPQVQRRVGARFHPASRVLAGDRAFVVTALQEAAALLSQGFPYCIIAGTDSYLRQNVVEAYMERRRILTAGNSNGFIPGEAGTAVLVGRAGGGDELQILGTAMGHEPATIDSDQPFVGNGLTQAVRGALAAAQTLLFDIDYRITDLNGEHYRFKEAAFVQARLQRKVAGGRQARPGWLLDLWHPIEFVGDVGAAVGPLILSVALHAGRKGYAPSPLSLCHFSNDDGTRAAAVVRYDPPTPNKQEGSNGW